MSETNDDDRGERPQKKQRADEQNEDNTASPIWDVIVNNDDISFKYILPKLEKNDIKFLYGVNSETRKLIKRAPGVRYKMLLSKKFRINAMSSISVLNFAWNNIRWETGEQGEYYGLVKKRAWFFFNVAQTNKLEFLKWAREEKGCDWHGETISMFAKRDNLETIKYCVENGCPIDSSACENAARNGNLEILKYLHETNDAPLSVKVSESAASGGHMDLLRYLAERHCPMEECTCYPAAKNGHFDCLKYILEDLEVPLHVLDPDEFPEYDRVWSYREDSLWAVARNGHLEVLRYLHEEKNFPIDENTCAYACEGGHLECLKYLHEDCNVELTFGAMLKAVGGGPNKTLIEDLDPEKRYEVVRYLVEKNLPIHDHLCTFVARNDYAPNGGCIPMLQFLRSEYNAPWSTDTTASTAEIGDLETLKYLVENGCPIDENAVINAAEEVKLECLKYLLEEVKVPLTPDCLSRPVAALQPGWFVDLFETSCLRYFITNKCSGWERHKDKVSLAKRKRTKCIDRCRCLKLLIKHKCPGWEEHKKRLSRYAKSDKRARERYQSLTDAEKERLARVYLSGDRDASSESSSFDTSDVDTDDDSDEELLD